MATVKGFKAIRPTPSLADKVASLPYDVMDSDEAREMVAGNPYSFLNIDRAEINFDPSVSPYDKVVYEKARDLLDNMREQGIFIQDESDNLYIYKQAMEGHSHIGLVGCTSIDEYLNNVIKKHEFTRPEKEEDRINHVDYCNANTGPIFITYNAQEEIDKALDSWMINNNPVNDFVSEDNVRHTVWVIDDPAVVSKLENEFAKIDSLYIADGHHRAASAVKVGLKRREEVPNYTGDEEFNFFLAVLVPDEKLNIMDYNRVVKDLNNHTPEEFLAKVEEKFLVTPCEGSAPYKPEKKHVFGMFLEDKWYKLEAKEGTFDENDPVERLDVSILQNNLLAPILGIENPRTDNRIDFVGGIRGLKELERRVKKDMKIAFSMYPTTVDDVLAIADAGEVMPPKSTWVEPKLRSGLFIHEL